METAVSGGDSGERITFWTYPRFLNYFFSNLSVFRRQPAREVFFRQMYFTSVEPLWRIAAVAALTGMVIITQISHAFGYDASLIGRALLWAVIRELGPLITAILMISGSGTAMTAELSIMKINGEFGSLRVMGINPLDYLVVPRMASAIISIFMLNAWFQASAILGGFALSSALMDISFHQHISSIFILVGVQDVAVSMLKSLVFGGIIAAASCSHGSQVGGKITEIPRAIIGAQMRSLFIVFMADGLITYFAFL